MATWSELPLVSIAQNSSFVPQYYIPEIINQADEAMKIYPFAGQLEKYGMRDHVGQTFTGNIKVKIGTYTGAGTLTAGTKIPLTNIVNKSFVGTIAELGNGVKMENFLLNVSPSDIEGKSVRIALGEDIADMLDVKVRNACYTATTTKLLGGTYASAWGVLGTLANYKMSYNSIVRLTTEKMKNNIDGDIPLFIHPYQWEDLVLETTTNQSFTDISKYSEKGYSQIIAGEIGKVGQYRVVVTNRVVGTKDSGAGGTVQTAVAFAFKPELAVGFAWALPTEIRLEADYDTDFGRTQALAHYSQGCAVKMVDEYIFLLKTTVRADIGAYAI